ncbi:MAG: hypothetical protein IJ446_01845 [Oscillospiraceae bacterium]|nr:hypothetical protein [Oscillospiraceae bacterium]
MEEIPLFTAEFIISAEDYTEFVEFMYLKKGIAGLLLSIIIFIFIISCFQPVRAFLCKRTAFPKMTAELLKAISPKKQAHDSEHIQNNRQKRR